MNFSHVGPHGGPSCDDLTARAARLQPAGEIADKSPLPSMQQNINIAGAGVKERRRRLETCDKQSRRKRWYLHVAACYLSGVIGCQFGAFSATTAGARQHVEALHGIDSGFIIVRVAPFRRPLGTFHQHLSLTMRHRVGKAKT